MELIPHLVFWFRRDLRLEDNAGLFHALKSGFKVKPIFIFDTSILNKLEDKDDARVTFIYQQLRHLKAELANIGADLKIYHDTATNVFSKLCADSNFKGAYCNEDYEPTAILRDNEIELLLKSKDKLFASFKDQVIFSPTEILKADGLPYTIYTPYKNKWLATLNNFYLSVYPTEKYFGAFLSDSPSVMPTIEQLDFKKNDSILFPPPIVDIDVIKLYDKTRDFPSIQGTTNLSVHLRFGTISNRKLARIALQNNSVWLSELVWREFYMMILWHFPLTPSISFKPQYDFIKWRNNENEFEAWCNGKTGYPIVDAGMRELNTTGLMHNRVRMIVASFLVKHLLIDWRWGEAYFARKLLDFEQASNVGNWQWAASCGCDAVPYFRVFNPDLQTEKFDKDLNYIKKWVPEYCDFDYPKPIVNHKLARERVLASYKEALSK